MPDTKRFLRLTVQLHTSFAFHTNLNSTNHSGANGDPGKVPPLPGNIAISIMAIVNRRQVRTDPWKVEADIATETLIQNIISRSHRPQLAGLEEQ